MEINTQVLIGALGGVVGSIATMVGKYFVDRLMERQKIELSLAAKRREKYYDKQTAVLAGTYERLARCLIPTLHSYPRSERHTKDEVQRIEESTDQACKAALELGAFIRENAIYFPRGMARRVHNLYTRLGNMAFGGRYFPVNAGQTFPKDTLEGYREFEKEMRELMDRLQEEFRNYMVDGVILPSNPDDSAEVFGS